MFLKSLNIVNFKNFESSDFIFSDKINCLVGENGVGKTNVLDAIHYLSFCKSYFNLVDSQNINHDASFFMLEGVFDKNERKEEVYCGLKRGQKKIVKKNNKAYSRLSDHIGQYPLVIISPYDRDLITDGSDVRRKFMDNVIGQSDKNYLATLIAYNRILSQRNALLKYFAQNGRFDATSLAVYDEQLIEYGTQIHEKRKAFVREFLPVFLKHHQTISKGKEEVEIVYESHLNEKVFTEVLRDGLAKDKVLQYTSVGIHRDDLSFLIKTFPVKKFGSQGQQKSFTIALKLAQFDFIKEHLGVKPILLLDDVFDKLDENRVSQLVFMVNEDHFGQIFISDTHPERMKEIVDRIHGEHKIFQLK
ncbi:DNA replication and repair protein RecF [Flavobacteriaceae bacterium UJ101]|nr:DNA replication and repair protein RecF [Flavobacteriaceae bacterium UJ101]